MESEQELPDLYGNFIIASTDEFLQEIINFTDADFENIIMVSDQELCASSRPVNEVREMVQELSKSDDHDLPPPELPATQATEESSKKRFKEVTTDKIKELASMNQSTATKKNTRWGTKILQEWQAEIYGQPLDLSTVTPDELGKKLAKFYCEATPQEKDKKFDLYHKNTLKNIRSAINRHLSDINRDIDIVHDKEFKNANNTLNGLLKHRVTSGTSRPTQHKEIINKNDLQKISTYLYKAYTDPIALRLCVWYILSIHFVTRGLEWHHQLTKNAFQFQIDENGNEFASLTHETRQKNYQGGINSDEANSDKRMYATNTETCPVKMLKFFIEKTDENATHLFNKISKHAKEYPNSCDIWYTTSALGKTIFCNFLPDLCKAADCSRRYTAHCLRATTIQAMSDAGIQTRQIMYMSGHRNEASVRSYSRDCSTSQKHTLSSILSATASGNDVTTSAIENCNHVIPSSSSSLSTPATNDTTPHTHTQMSNTMSCIKSGFLTNSTFNNCQLTINMNI